MHKNFKSIIFGLILGIMLLSACSAHKAQKLYLLHENGKKSVSSDLKITEGYKQLYVYKDTPLVFPYVLEKQLSGEPIRYQLWMAGERKLAIKLECILRNNNKDKVIASGRFEIMEGEGQQYEGILILKNQDNLMGEVLYFKISNVNPFWDAVLFISDEKPSYFEVSFVRE